MNDLRKAKLSIGQKIGNWWHLHISCLFASFVQLVRSPIASILTIAVIGITLALPLGLSLVMDKMAALSGSIDSSNSVSLYLKQGTAQNVIDELRVKLQSDSKISEVSFISSEQGLETFSQSSASIAGELSKQFADQSKLIDLLGENPLPAVLTLQPNADVLPKQLEAMVLQLEKREEVELVQFDSHWARRLHSLIQLLDKFSFVLTILLISSVLLIIGNTIRVSIQSRIEEIQLSRLFGATTAFIRRPFLHTGFLYGIFGGLLASLVLTISYVLLAEPLQQLLSAYQIELGAQTSSLIRYCIYSVIGGSFLGVISSWLMVFLYQKGLENKDIT